MHGKGTSQNKVQKEGEEERKESETLRSVCTSLRFVTTALVAALAGRSDDVLLAVEVCSRRRSTYDSSNNNNEKGGTRDSRRRRKIVSPDPRIRKEAGVGSSVLCVCTPLRFFIEIFFLSSAPTRTPILRTSVKVFSLRYRVRRVDSTAADSRNWSEGGGRRRRVSGRSDIRTRGFEIHPTTGFV